MDSYINWDDVDFGTTGSTPPAPNINMDDVDFNTVGSTTEDDFESPVTQVELADGSIIFKKSNGTYVDGNGNQVDSTGKLLNTGRVDETGRPGPKNNTATNPPTQPTPFLDKLKTLYTSSGDLDPAKIATLMAIAGGAMQSTNRTQPAGYQGSVDMSRMAVRDQVSPANQPRAYGQPAMGRRYFSDTQYTNPQGLAAAQAASQQQAQQLAAAQQPPQPIYEPTRQQVWEMNHPQPKTDTNDNPMRPRFPAENRFTDLGILPSPNPTQEYQEPVAKAAHGGLMAARGQYLRGSTDGMADKLRTSIDGKQPAALSHGEFVIPADVVSHLGNGNSDAGAKRLYSMMDKIRMARTGTKEQGHQINPDKFMPGGSVQRYAEGGTTLPAGTTGVESNLSNYVGPYVTDMLSKGQALSNAPYQAYTGQLTAGTSPLQQQAFNTAANLQTPAGINQAGTTAGDIATKAQGLNYAPTTTIFGNEQAQQYMNPYLKAALDPQMAELQRQNQIANMNANAKLTQAGGFGGGRQAVMNAENTRNMMQQMNTTLGQGYSTAFDKAQAQFNADQARKMQEAQFGANYGLQGLQTGLQAAGLQGQMGTAQNQAQLANLSAQSGLGATQRGIEQEALAADKAQFEEERANPYKMLQFQQSLLQGLPLAAQTYNQAPTNVLTNAASNATTMNTLLKALGLI